MFTTKIYKIAKGKKIFYARIDMDLDDGNYIGLQCYKDGEYIYSKWNSMKTLKFNKSEIIEIFTKDVIE